jgi:hypothetical protein
MSFGCIIKEEMSRRPDDRFWRSLSLIGIALYAVVLVTAPFQHHDLLCHLKTPQHCTSCASSQLGADPHPPAILGGGHLADAGTAVSPLVLVTGTLIAASTTGRSPPINS